MFMSNYLKKRDAKNKKGQITIFIILALLIVVIGVLIFVFLDIGKKPSDSVNLETISPNVYLESCIEEEIDNTLYTLSKQGGYLESDLSIEFRFGNEDYWNISYLCYTGSPWLSCNVIQPLLINHLKKEISNEITKEMSSCFDGLISDFQKKGYVINSKNYNGFEVDLNSNDLVIDIDAELSMNKGDETISQDKFEIIFSGEGLYDLALVVNEIVNQQAQYCSFNEVGYMSLYPDYEISWEPASNETKIYNIKQKSTRGEFRFAVRSCVPLSNI